MAQRWPIMCWCC